MYVRLRRHLLAMLDPIRDHAKSKRFSLRTRLGFGRAINQNAGEARHFADPPPIVFPRDLDLEHNHYNIECGQF